MASSSHISFTSAYTVAYAHPLVDFSSLCLNLRVGDAIDDAFARNWSFDLQTIECSSIIAFNGTDILSAWPGIRSKGASSTRLSGRLLRPVCNFLFWIFFDLLIFDLIVNNIEYGRGEATTLGGAKEEAARQVLIAMNEDMMRAAMAQGVYYGYRWRPFHSATFFISVCVLLLRLLFQHLPSVFGLFPCRVGVLSGLCYETLKT